MKSLIPILAVALALAAIPVLACDVACGGGGGFQAVVVPPSSGLVYQQSSVFYGQSHGLSDAELAAILRAAARQNHHHHNGGSAFFVEAPKRSPRVKVQVVAVPARDNRGPIRRFLNPTGIR